MVFIVQQTKRNNYFDWTDTKVITNLEKKNANRRHHEDFVDHDTLCVALDLVA